MRILVLAGSYPHPGHPFTGVFNEKCVTALRGLCDAVAVLAPRPYVPPLMSFVPRWKAYTAIVEYEVRDGISIYRPATPVIPHIGTALWSDLAAFLWCRHTIRKMYRNIQFDAIVSFNLVETGGIAWRIGQELGIPASGWAFGNDVRFPRSSALGQVVRRAIERLDIVFYQSHELLEQAAGLLGMPLDRMLRNHHIVLSHGIPEPPSLPKTEIRNRMRAALGIPDRQIAIFSLGRIVREKGIYELLDAISLAIVRDSRLTCAIVGSNPTFDETTAIQKKLDQTPGLQERVRLLPACNPDKVWDYLCAADIFVFPSHKEGMPNSLLEAMAMGIPAVAFAIPPVLEIDAGSGGLIAVPPFDPVLLSEAILFLASSPDNRVRIGERGREQVLDRFMVRKNMASALDRITKRVQKRLPLQNRYCHESASS